MKNQTNTNKYNLTNDVIKKEVDDILKGKYQQCVLGTLDQNGYPYLSKTLPLYYEKKIYLLLSDLSDHTENLKINKKVSIYFAQEEIHKERLNNPRLTLLGLIKKLKLNKNDEFFRKLLKNYILIEKSAKMWGEFLDFNFSFVLGAIVRIILLPCSFHNKAFFSEFMLSSRLSHSGLSPIY